METIPIALDNGKVRRVLHDGEWYFAVADAVAALTDTVVPVDSWGCLKRQELLATGVDLSALCRLLELEDANGRKQQEETATLEGIFRIVQSISSPKAEVFKRWLARAGRERNKRQGYRTDLDVIFSMLGEAATAEIARKQNAQGFAENHVAVRKGGKIAGDAREKLEIETGDKMVSSENYLTEPESRKRLKARSEDKGKQQ